VEDTGALVDVNLCTVVFAEVVSVVLLTASPVDAILALANAIFDPVKAHVDGAGVTLADVVIGESGGGAVYQARTTTQAVLRRESWTA